jgi:PKD repeat protein
VYNVCLTVYDSLTGCFNTYCDEISVLGDIDQVDAYIEADFSYFLDQNDGKVHFRDESVGNPSVWYWDFGDGDSAGVTQDPMYEYTEDGYYEVCLTAKKHEWRTGNKM